MKSWLEISERRLTDNYRVITEVADETAVLAVVKANAYGHGAAICASVLANAGAPWLGVTDVAEGCTVRKALMAEGLPHSHQPRILVMSGLLPEEAEDVVQHRLTPVVWTPEQMQWLTSAMGLHDMESLAVHVEVDTGMARQGVAPGPGLDALLQWLSSQNAIRLDGVMTHFASSEVAHSSQTRLQRERFEIAMRQVALSGLRPGWVHAGNSSTLDNQGPEKNPEWLRSLAATIGAQSMIRTGIGLYGYCLPVEKDPDSTTVVEAEAKVRPKVLPVMAWKTRVIGLRGIQPGDTVGYNGIFAAQQQMRLALLPVGYADGLRRELSASNGHHGGWAIIAGKQAPIVGRVSMNLTVVDVTELPPVVVGDEVTVLGDGVTAEDHARLAGTISYEILCGMRAVPRLVK